MKSSTSRAEEPPQSRSCVRAWYYVAMLSYSPASTLHPQVLYAIVFSAGLTASKLTKLIVKTLNELLITLLTASTAHAQ